MNKKKTISLVAAVVVLLAVVGGVFAWRAAGQKRTYEQTLAAYDSEDFQTAANLFESLGNYEDSESRYQSCQYELTVDRRFLRTIAKGLEERWDSDVDTNDPVAMQKMIEAELANLKEFKSAAFEDAHLQQDAADYIQALEDSIEAQAYANSDYNKYITLWNACYTKRGQVIVDLYNNYALPVGSEYEDTVREFVNTVKAAESKQAELDALMDVLQNHMTLEFTGNIEHLGYATVGADVCIENNTAYDISGLMVEIRYYNSDGSKSTNYTSIYTDVGAGKTVREPLELYNFEEDDPNGSWKIDYESISCSIENNWYENLF